MARSISHLDELFLTASKPGRSEGEGEAEVVEEEDYRGQRNRSGLLFIVIINEFWAALGFILLLPPYEPVPSRRCNPFPRHGQHEAGRGIAGNGLKSHRPLWRRRKAL